MRIAAPGSSLPAGARREAGRAGPAGAFSLGGPRAAGAGPPGAAAAVPALAPTALHALVALQGLPDASDRRRSARRGAALLDRLEEIRLALLDAAELPADGLAGLRGELAAARAASGDPGLDDLLREIEVRAAVELAKLEVAGAQP